MQWPWPDTLQRRLLAVGAVIAAVFILHAALVRPQTARTRPTTLRLPNFPEQRAGFTHQMAVRCQCTSACTRRQMPSWQQALQMCLKTACTSLAYAPDTREAIIAHRNTSIACQGKSGSVSDTQYVYSTRLNVGGGSPVDTENNNDVQCEAGKFCVVPTALKRLANFTRGIQRFNNMTENGKHAMFNPAFFELNGTTYIVMFFLNSTVEKASRNSTRSPICPLTADFEPIVEDCFFPDINYDDISKTMGRTDYRSFSDPRGIVDAATGTVYILAAVWVYEKPVEIYQELTLLKPDMRSSENSVKIDCVFPDNPHPTLSKNFMPLTIDGVNYLVTFALPLEIAKPNLDKFDGSCDRVYHEPNIKRTSVPVAPGYSVEPRGTTPFVRVKDDVYVAVLHWYREGIPRIYVQEYRYRRVYMHSFFAIKVFHDKRGPNKLVVDWTWMSESFRLPVPKSKNVHPVQFATGLLLRNGNLYIGYGIGDNSAHVAQIEGFQDRFDDLMQYGLTALDDVVIS